MFEELPTKVLQELRDKLAAPNKDALQALASAAVFLLKAALDETLEMRREREQAKKK